MATETITSAGVLRTFPTLAEFVDWTNAPAPDATSRSSHDTDSARGWMGTETWGEAIRHAEGGWDEGVKRIERMRVAISAKVGTAPRRVTTMREVGPGTLDMGRFVQGHPQSYAVIQDRQVVRKGKGKIVRLYVSGICSGGISTGVIERRGAAVCALVDALERAGRRVEVVVTFPNGECRGKWLIYRVTVKAAEARLNLPTLAFALAHPSMFRRLTFAGMEHETPTVQKRHTVGTAYGRVGEDKSRPADAVYLSSAMLGAPQWASVERAQAWVKDELTRQGVTLA